jgi:hypothetical protein
MHVILVIWEADIGTIEIQSQPGQKSSKDSISKITRTKWTIGVAQAVKRLPCKHEALSSKSQFHKKDNKRMKAKNLYNICAIFNTPFSLSFRRYYCTYNLL